MVVLDFAHMYDMYRFNFLSAIMSKVPFLHSFYSILELQYHIMRGLCDRYGVGAQPTSAVVFEHFKLHVIQSYMS